MSSVAPWADDWRGILPHVLLGFARQAIGWARESLRVLV